MLYWSQALSPTRKSWAKCHITYASPIVKLATGACDTYHALEEDRKAIPPERTTKRSTFNNVASNLEKEQDIIKEVRMQLGQWLPPLIIMLDMV